MWGCPSDPHSLGGTTTLWHLLTTLANEPLMGNDGQAAFTVTKRARNTRNTHETCVKWWRHNDVEEGVLRATLPK